MSSHNHWRESKYLHRIQDLLFSIPLLSYCIGRLKKISACCVESSGNNFLIGTENGNIYVMDLDTFEVTDSVIYLDVVMQK